MSLFRKATKQQAKLRLALAGPAGSGKTYTSLLLATMLAQHEGGRTAVIDTENGSASKYADLFDFDAVSLTASTGFAPERYLEMLKEAESAGYPVIVMDSLSHEWAGQDGILQAVDQAAAQVSGNKFVAWGRVTPRHDKLVRAIVESPAHIICTLRAKMEYVQEKNDRGRTEIRAVGMKPIQRDELEYEFDVYGLLDQDNRLIVRKSRCPQLSGAVIDKPGKDVGDVLTAWLTSGEAVVEPVQPAEIVGVPVYKPGPERCNKQAFQVSWNSSVKRTRFDDADTTAKFIEWYSDGKHTTLDAFLDAASRDEASELIKAINERIAYEAKKAAS